MYIFSNVRKKWVNFFAVETVEDILNYLFSSLGNNIFYLRHSGQTLANRDWSILDTFKMKMGSLNLKTYDRLVF